MIDLEEAKAALLNVLPSVKIEKFIRYRDVYLFQVAPSPEGDDLDPFFSVDVNTAQVKDFAILVDGDIGEIGRLFTDKTR